MKEWRFIIEFCAEYDCNPSPFCDEVKRLRRIGDRVGENALRKYLTSSVSPLNRYSFESPFQVTNIWSDETRRPLYDETVQIGEIVGVINRMVSRDDIVVIHIWGHANNVEVGFTSYGSLIDIFHSIKCAHLYINLMNSCFTCGAKEFGDDLTTIWYTTRGADNASHDDFDPESDDPTKYSLSERAKNEFGIPFLIYDCWDESKSKYDFSAFLIKVRENDGMADLYGTTDQN